MKKLPAANHTAGSFFHLKFQDKKTKLSMNDYCLFVRGLYVRVLLPVKSGFPLDDFTVKLYQMLS